MPFINGADLTPEEAVTHGFCPECGRPLSETTAELEISTHWPRGLDPSVCCPEGIRRAGLIRAYFEQAGQN